MSRFERDTIKRQIQQLGDVLAVIVAGSRGETNVETGLEAVREAAQNGLGVDYALLERLAPNSAAMMLRDPDAVEAYARVCTHEADLLASAGRDDEAAARRRRAEGLRIEAEGLRIRPTTG
jgi:hypothetical protein